MRYDAKEVGCGKGEEWETEDGDLFSWLVFFIVQCRCLASAFVVIFSLGPGFSVCLVCVGVYSCVTVFCQDFHSVG